MLQHLGIQPGDRIELDKLPDGRVTLKAARPPRAIDDFLGLLAGKSPKIATLDEINDAITAGWTHEKVKLTVDTNVLVRAVVRADT